MEIEQINNLVNKLLHCDSNLETYQKGRKKIIPFKDLPPYILQVLAFFEEQNIQRGDKIGIIGTNTFEWVVIDIACIAAGIITMPLDPLVSYDIHEVLREFELPLVVSNIEIYSKCENVFRFEDVIQNQRVPKNGVIVPVHYEPTDVLSYKSTSGSTQRRNEAKCKRSNYFCAANFSAHKPG